MCGGNARDVRNAAGEDGLYLVEAGDVEAVLYEDGQGTNESGGGEV